jgi:hypothetical protein
LNFGLAHQQPAPDLGHPVGQFCRERPNAEAAKLAALGDAERRERKEMGFLELGSSSTRRVWRRPNSV